MKISQREARRLRKRVAELEGLEHLRANAYASEYPGIHIGSMQADTDILGRINTARLLKHGVAAQPHAGEIRFFAVPLWIGATK